MNICMQFAKIKSLIFFNTERHKQLTVDTLVEEGRSPSLLKRRGIKNIIKIHKPIFNEKGFSTDRKSVV